MNVAQSGAMLLVVAPLTAAMVAFARPRLDIRATLVAGVVMLAAALGLVRAVLQEGVWRHDLGGWAAPLGIGWQVDGPSAAMLLLTTLVVGGSALYRAAEGVRSRYFWPLWLFLWSGLNALFLSADLFNLYVTLEFVSLAAVGLIALAGGPALAAAWRYFLATLLGSSVYLLGVALWFGRYGTLDLYRIVWLPAADSATQLAAVMMTLGLLLKGAVFPLHFWLPTAHGRAPTAVSAVLSGIVVAAAFYLLLRLWFGPFAALLNRPVAVSLGLLGAAAILWGGILALLQRRLKMLIAYSTVSQMGYGMLVFPLAGAGDSTGRAWQGAVMLVLAHGLAKAALFLAGGSIVRDRGHDRIGRHGGTGQGSACAWLAFALAAASLIGLPPTGGFVGKWWLLQAALISGGWFWVGVILGGTLLTTAYLFRVLEGAPLVAPATTQASRQAPVLAMAALMLALAAWLLGLLQTFIGPLLLLTSGREG